MPHIEKLAIRLKFGSAILRKNKSKRFQSYLFLAFLTKKPILIRPTITLYTINNHKTHIALMAFLINQ